MNVGEYVGHLKTDVLVLRVFVAIENSMRTLLLGLLLCATVRVALAQPDEPATIDLTSLSWRYQAGDSAVWASPSYNDSAWLLASPAEGQAGSAAANMGWFRVTFALPDSLCLERVCALQVGVVQGAHEVYLNGVRIGAYGRMGPRGIDVYAIPSRISTYVLPDPALKSADEHVLAVRMQNWMPYPLTINGKQQLGDYAVLMASKRRGEFIQRILEPLAFVSGFSVILATLFWIITYGYQKAHGLFLAFGVLGIAGMAFTYVVAGQPELLSPFLIALTNMLWFIYLLVLFQVIKLILGWKAPVWTLVFWVLSIGSVSGHLLTKNDTANQLWFAAAMLVGMILLGSLIVIMVRAMRRGMTQFWPLLIGLSIATVTLAFPLAIQVGDFHFMPIALGDSCIFLGLGISATLHFGAVEREAKSLLQEADSLRQLDEMKSRLFANISHEFRTPITLIQGPVGSALDGHYGPVNPELRDGLHMVQRNSQRLGTLLEQLLDLTRLEAGKLKLQAEYRDLVAWVRHHVETFSGLAEQAQVGLRVEADVEHVYLYMDPDLLEKIITNLVGNALKFTPTHGHIIVRIEDAPTYDEGTGAFVSLAVSDTGEGIPPEALDRIFDRFYQVEETATRRWEGTGIGLALVKELVELHGGSIDVASTVGEGTTFTVSLPKGRDHLGNDEIRISDQVPPGEGAYQETLATVEQAQRSRSSILVVEDNADMRGFLRQHLRSTYAVVEASDGEAGLAQALASPPDLIISDVMMPRMDGLAFLAALRDVAALRTIPVILLTARTEQADRMAGLEARADAYLAKPFSPNELKLHIRNLLEVRDAYRENTGTQHDERQRLSSTDEAFVRKVRHIIEENMSDGSFGVRALAGALFMSESSLFRRMKALTDQSPAQFIRQLRLTHAQKLLNAQARETVAEVAYAVGFTKVKYFSRLYRQTYGETPSEVLRQGE